MTSRADQIAAVVLSQFDRLPSKRKPAVRHNGLHEWVPLAGIVAEKQGKLTCLALATGMKCLPAVRVPKCNGISLHDWHAEILAIRTFNRFLLEECANFLQDGCSSFILETNCEATDDGKSSSCPFAIRDDVKLHMYCSEAPCGDASMELIMAAQDDDSPWDVPARPVATADSITPTDGTLPGRAYFSQLGIVRRKPARGDAPPTMSKSCSDKLALKQCTSLLSSLASLLISPRNAYINTLIVPETQFSAQAFDRAFSQNGRMASVKEMGWAGGYMFRPFTVETTSVEFQYSKRAVTACSDKSAPSNLASAWSLSGVEETIVNGVIQGRKPAELKGASRMSRRETWTLTLEVARQLQGWPEIQSHLSAESYIDAKAGIRLAARENVKADVRRDALTGWLMNEGDSGFGLYNQT